MLSSYVRLKVLSLRCRRAYVLHDPVFACKSYITNVQKYQETLFVEKFKNLRGFFASFISYT